MQVRDQLSEACISSFDHILDLGFRIDHSVLMRQLLLVPMKNLNHRLQEAL